jgi:hypothetical protein
MALTDLKRILGTAKRGAPLVTAGNVPNAADELNGFNEKYADFMEDGEKL